MPLLTLEDLSRELSIPCEHLRELIAKNVIVPYGGRARLGDPVFSAARVPEIKAKVLNNTK